MDYNARGWILSATGFDLLSISDLQKATSCCRSSFRDIMHGSHHLILIHPSIRSGRNRSRRRYIPRSKPKASVWFFGQGPGQYVDASCLPVCQVGQTRARFVSDWGCTCIDLILGRFCPCPLARFTVRDGWMDGRMVHPYRRKRTISRCMGMLVV